MNQLTRPNAVHLKEMITWFGSEAELREWAGPDFRYPYTLDSFSKALKLETLNSFCITDQSDTLLSFGQCYERVGRWHLGRLAVSPMHRGQGLVQELIQHLTEFGERRHGISNNSLFVMHQNTGAIRAYEKCGFVFAEYPEKMPMQGTHYMIRDQEIQN